MKESSALGVGGEAGKLAPCFRTQACRYTLAFFLLCAHVAHVTCEPTLAAARVPARPAAPAPSKKMYELDLLTTLGWQHVYDPSGYSINASLPDNCSLFTWLSLGSLHTVTNLTLNGNLPDLPDSWASNGSFPSLLAMNFSETDLGGSLPSSWSSSSAFPQLSTLSFNATHLSGTLSDAWGQPGSFSKLTELYLDHTNITGPLPLAWGTHGAFPALITLYVDATSLTGTVPAAWGRNGAFPSIVRLQLGSTGLAGTLPAEWGSESGFQQLTHLLITNCSITGTIPLSWAEPAAFPALQALQFQATQLTGSLPALLGTNGSLPALIFLEVDSSPLSGTLPEEWGSPSGFNQLGALKLTNCNISGTLPASWGAEGRFPALLYLFLTLTNLTGSLPPSWGGRSSFPSLEALTIGLNTADISGLSGTLPPEWGSAVAFQHISLLAITNCNITGTIPASWGGVNAFPSLAALTLYDVPLTGSLPAEWGSHGSLPAMQGLRLGTGRRDFSCLSGTLPADWASAAAFQNLTKLEIGGCMTGSIPTAWGSPGTWPALEILVLHITNLTGSLPASWGDEAALPSLRNLEIGSGVALKNSLSGTLPDEWGNSGAFSQLELLRVVNCSIHGTLPSSWSNPGAFPSLITLTLFDMALTGSLPASWADNGSFPSLGSMGLGADRAGRLDCISGPMPADWASPFAFQLLEILALRTCFANIYSQGNVSSVAVVRHQRSVSNLLSAHTSTVPASWGSAGSFPALSFLDLEDCQLTGTMPASWPPALQILTVPGNNFDGPLPVGLSQLAQLQQLSLDGNAFTGQLPPDWGNPEAFPSLFSLHCADTHLTGSLPPSWGSPTALTGLKSLVLRGANITGSLPESWATDGAFPSLLALGVADTDITGTFPASWASTQAFPQLQVLDLESTRLHGSLPAFNNTALKAVLLKDCYFNSTLNAVWISSAPLEILSLSYNFLSGSLPDSPDALSELTFLDTSHNKMQGTLPLSWLQAHHLMSHISVLNVGTVWEKSQAQTDWRQQLCLKRMFYDTDITGQRAALLPALKQSLSAFTDHTTAAFVYNTDYSSWLQSGLTLDALNQLVQGTNNQLTSVRDICANRSSDRVLLVVWLVFAACAMTILTIYVAATWVRHKYGSKQLKVWPCCIPMQDVCVALYETFYGLGGLTFYYYDLVTSIIVLVQVWGTWPAGVLIAIFLFHFAITGFLVTFRLILWYIGLKYDMLQPAPSLYVVVIGSSLLAGPFMIPVILILDTCAFLRQVVTCCQRITRLFHLQWVRPGFVVASSIHRCLHDYGYLGFSWIDLDGYEGMHNLVAAFLQSLPTVILNSVLFALGNKPSHGVFFSNALFVAAIVASCLAMLRCLAVILWQAFRTNRNAVKHLGTVLTGVTLAARQDENVLSSGSHVQLNKVSKLVQMYHMSGSGPLGGA